TPTTVWAGSQRRKNADVTSSTMIRTSSTRLTSTVSRAFPITPASFCSMCSDSDGCTGCSFPGGPTGMTLPAFLLRVHVLLRKDHSADHDKAEHQQHARQQSRQI